MLARFAIVASACLALTLGGCSLTPSSSANTSGFTGTKATIATKINQLASDVSSSDGLDICENVLATSVRAKLNKVGSCQTIIKNQIKTIDDNTITIEKISLAGTTALKGCRPILTKLASSCKERSPQPSSARPYWRS